MDNLIALLVVLTTVVAGTVVARAIELTLTAGPEFAADEMKAVFSPEHFYSRTQLLQEEDTQGKLGVEFVSELLGVSFLRLLYPVRRYSFYRLLVDMTIAAARTLTEHYLAISQSPNPLSALVKAIVPVSAREALRKGLRKVIRGVRHLLAWAAPLIPQPIHAASEAFAGKASSMLLWCFLHLPTSAQDWIARYLKQAADAQKAKRVAHRMERLKNRKVTYGSSAPLFTASQGGQA